MLIRGDFWQKSRDQILSAGKHHQRRNEQNHACNQVSLANKAQQPGRHNAPDGGKHEKASLPRVLVGDGADHGTAKQNDDIADGNRKRPEEGGRT
jgi:hypothetical protein